MVRVCRVILSKALQPKHDLKYITGFNEFYNQRRRWTPSTMANIIDLLLDYKNVIKRNPDICMLYISYQVLLMVSSILTPGTIFLMIVGSINLAFPSLSLYMSLLVNAIPIVIFVVLIFFTKPDIQVNKS